MKIGEKVKCDLYEDYEIGKIISKENVFNREFYNVFFDKVGKTVKIDKENLNFIEDKNKFEKFFEQKAKAISQIKIDNIRLGKRRELRRERSGHLLALKKKSRLFPKLECIQISIIKFR